MPDRSQRNHDARRQNADMGALHRAGQVQVCASQCRGLCRAQTGPLKRPVFREWEPFAIDHRSIRSGD
jgi:hypothetical protein